MSFELEKHNALTKTDKSHEGKWDEHIKPLCDAINLNPSFFTSSSCSGRITLIKATDKKESDIFLYKSHKETSPESLFHLIESLKEKEIVYFKMEACVLHVACNNLEDALILLEKARSAGWKRSGIIPSKDKFVCELGSTEVISCPLTKETNKEYLALLVGEANKKLEKTHEKIDNLLRKIIS